MECDAPTSLASWLQSVFVTCPAAACPPSCLSLLRELRRHCEASRRYEFLSRHLNEVATKPLALYRTSSKPASPHCKLMPGMLQIHHI